MKRILFTPLILILLSCHTVICQNNSAQWTIMIYMVADNDLEPFAIEDFEEMSSIGSTDDVNIIVQLDLSQNSNYWTDTRRFRVEKGQTVLDQPLSNLGEINMGDPQSLTNFISWGIEQYPAAKYSLVVWNHGSGWRDSQLGKGKEEKSYSKSVGSDDSNQDFLYLKEVQEGIDNALGENNLLDIIGFDACLMGMLEVWYSLDEFAEIGIASEDLEPGFGWPYDRFLKELIATPTLTPKELSQKIVSAYGDYCKEARKNLYEFDYTLSSIELSYVDSIASSISSLSSRIRDGNMWGDIELSRKQCKAYAFEPKYSWPNGIDLLMLIEEIIESSEDESLIQLAERVKSYIEQSVIANVANWDNTNLYGSNGIAIYFPLNHKIFSNDFEKEGYKKSNKKMVVDFVKNEEWSDFLADYFDYQKKK